MEAVGSVEIEFRPSPVVSGLRGGVGYFGGGGPTASAGENAVFDVEGAGFFPGLTCVWCGVAGAEANVLSSVAARCEQPGLETLKHVQTAGAAATNEGVACALGLVSGGADDGLLGAATVADGPTALVTPSPAEMTAVAPSAGPASGGSAATATLAAGFSSRRIGSRDGNGDFFVPIRDDRPRRGSSRGWRRRALRDPRAFTGRRRRRRRRRARSAWFRVRRRRWD